MTGYAKGDYTQCLEHICEIWFEDNLYCIVRTEDADKILEVLNENEQLKEEIENIKDVNVRCCNDYSHYRRENEQLKSVNQELRKELQFDAKQYKVFIDVIDKADDLICSYLSKHYQRQWKNFCKNKEVDV